MAQTNQISTTKLSDLIRDPIVRAAFQRAERDYGQAFAIPNDLPPAGGPECPPGIPPPRARGPSGVDRQSP